METPKPVDTTMAASESPVPTGTTENINQEEPKSNSFEFSSGAFTEKDIHQLFKMNRQEIEEALGTDYIEAFTGNEGDVTYEYVEHGITIQYDYYDYPYDNVWYLHCSEDVSIYGTNSTMLYDEIQSKLENSIRTTWSPEEDEDIVFYRLTCDIDNMRIKYSSSNENGEESNLTVIRISPPGTSAQGESNNTKSKSKGLIAEEGDWIYFNKEDDSGERHLYKWNTKNDSIEIVCEEDTDLIFVENGWVYYTTSSYDNILTEVTKTKIYRERIDGSNNMLILSGNIWVKAVVGDFIYYTDNKDGESNNTLYKIKLSDEDEEKEVILVNNNCNIPYFTQDIIYYLKTGDEYAIYRMNLDGTNDTKLFDIDISKFNITSIAYLQKRIYLLDRASSDSRKEGGIYSTNLNGSGEIIFINDNVWTEFVVLGHEIYYTNEVDSGKPETPEANSYKIMLNVFDMATGKKKVLHEIDSHFLDATDGYIYYYRNNKTSRLSIDTHEEEILGR